MMFRFKTVKGFSLIEMMVVLAIMATVMALTGGLVVKTVAQQERQIELEKVRQIFKKAAYQAYYSGQNIELNLNANVLTVDGSSVTEIPFQQLTFVAETYQISNRAIISPEEFGVFISEQPKFFKIPPFLERYESK